MWSPKTSPVCARYLFIKTATYQSGVPGLLFPSLHTLFIRGLVLKPTMSWKILLMGNFQTLTVARRQFCRFMTSQGNLFKFQLEIKEETFASLFIFCPETMLKAMLKKQWGAFSNWSARGALPFSLVDVEVRPRNDLHIFPATECTFLRRE